MKKRVLFFLPILFCITAFGQTINESIEWSAPLSAKTHSVSGVFYSDDTHFYTYGKQLPSGLLGLSAGKEVYISKYRKNDFRREWHLKVDEVKYKGYTAAFDTVAYIGDKIFLFMEVYNKKDEKKELLLRTVSLEGKISKMEPLDEIQTNRKTKGDLFIRVSKDNKRFAVLAEPKSKRKDDMFMRVKVFDENAKELWNEDVTFDLLMKEAKIIDTFVSNSGDVFFVIHDYRDFRNQARKSKSDFIVAKSSKSLRGKVEEVHFTTSKFITSVGVLIDHEENKAVLSGVYSDGAGKTISGIYYGFFDQESLKFEEKATSPFTDDFLKAADVHLKLKGKKEMKQKTGKFIFRDILSTSDGGTIILAEAYYFRIVSSTDSRGVTRTNYYYGYNEVIAAKFDKSGKLEWNHLIPKRQNTKNDGGRFSGFVSSYKQGSIKLIFNDHHKNIGRLKSGKKLKNCNFAVTTVVKIDDKGNMTRKVIQDNKKVKTRFMPHNTISANIDETEFITKGYWKLKRFSASDFRYGKILL